MCNHPNLIFDFDGTLVDSFSAVVNTFDLLSDEFYFRKINRTAINDLRNLTARELIQHLRIPFYQLPWILRKARKHMQSQMNVLLPHIGLREVLQICYELNFAMGILTSNTVQNVLAWLQYNKLRHFFKFVHMESSYFKKQRELKKILTFHDMDHTKTFYIGDETRDIEAAKQCDIYSIAVAWGFNSEKLLLAHHPDFFIHHPQELLAIVGR